MTDLGHRAEFSTYQYERGERVKNEENGASTHIEGKHAHVERERTREREKKKNKEKKKGLSVVIRLHDVKAPCHTSQCVQRAHKTHNHTYTQNHACTHDDTNTLPHI